VWRASWPIGGERTGRARRDWGTVGCHCAHLLIKRLLNIPPALEQFQGLILTLFPQVALPGLTRVSLASENSAEDVDALTEVLDKIARQPRTGVNRRAVRQQMDDFARAVAQRVYAYSRGVAATTSTK